jgi:hypothetical protein
MLTAIKAVNDALSQFSTYYTRPTFSHIPPLDVSLDCQGGYRKTKIIAGCSASNRSRNNHQGFSNGSWNLVYFWVKICSSGALSTSGIFDVFACISTTKGAMDKRRRQADSAHWIGLETSLVAFLILGW